MGSLRDDRIYESWKDFFEEYCKSDIETIALSYPEKRSLEVDFSVIDKANLDLAHLLINHPDKAIFNAEQALMDIDTANPNKIKLHFRPYNLPDTCKVDINKIRAKHFGRSVAINGRVKVRTMVMQKVDVAAFECRRCGAIIHVEPGGDILIEPSECYEKQGGCGRVSIFKFLPDLSRFVDSQEIHIKEVFEGLPYGGNPGGIPVYLEDDLTGKIGIGDRVIVNGILHSVERKHDGNQLTTFGKKVVAYSIEIENG